MPIMTKLYIHTHGFLGKKTGRSEIIKNGKQRIIIKIDDSRQRKLSGGSRRPTSIDMTIA